MEFIKNKIFSEKGKGVKKNMKRFLALVILVALSISGTVFAQGALENMGAKMKEAKGLLNYAKTLEQQVVDVSTCEQARVAAEAKNAQYEGIIASLTEQVNILEADLATARAEIEELKNTCHGTVYDLAFCMDYFKDPCDENAGFFSMQDVLDRLMLEGWSLEAAQSKAVCLCAQIVQFFPEFAVSNGVDGHCMDANEIGDNHPLGAICGMDEEIPIEQKYAACSAAFPGPSVGLPADGGEPDPSIFCVSVEDGKTILIDEAMKNGETLEEATASAIAKIVCLCDKFIREPDHGVCFTMDMVRPYEVECNFRQSDPCEGRYGDGFCDQGCWNYDPDCDPVDPCSGKYGDGFCDEGCWSPDPDCIIIDPCVGKYNDGVCDNGCLYHDPDCDLCGRLDGYCDTSCIDQDPDCAACRLDGICVLECSAHYGVVDPDCQECLPADGICLQQCMGQDPDCDCELLYDDILANQNGICEIDCPIHDPDPECITVCNGAIGGEMCFSSAGWGYCHPISPYPEQICGPETQCVCVQ